MHGSHPIGLLATVLALGCSPSKSHGGPQPAPLEDASTADEGNADGDVEAANPTPDAPIPPTPDLPCNGQVAYCAMRYDELCQAATHDSAASSAQYWRYPTQNQAVSSQLATSIRVLSLEVERYQDAVSVCRGDCTLGNTPFRTVLLAVKDFLDANPREVVTLLVDTSLDVGSVEPEFVASGLDAVAWAQNETEPWPTLQAMIDASKRLVVFANPLGTGPPWLLPRQDWIWETGSDWTSLPAMNCSPAVGDTARPLYLVYHGLVEAPDGDRPGQPSEALASEANAWPTVTARLQACAAQFGHGPNFVVVDFFNLGDPIGATQVMNGVRSAP
jgi:hypothetical protein